MKPSFTPNTKAKKIGSKTNTPGWEYHSTKGWKKVRSRNENQYKFLHN